MPESSAPPVPSEPGPLASDDVYPPSRRPSGSQRNGCLDRCTARRIIPCFRSPFASLPSPSWWILPPPVARSRSRWWRHLESRSGRTTARLRTTGVCCHQCPTTCPPSPPPLFPSNPSPVFALPPPPHLPP